MHSAMISQQQQQFFSFDFHARSRFARSTFPEEK